MRGARGDGRAKEASHVVGLELGWSDADGHLEDGGGAGAEEDGAADFADEGGHISGVVLRERFGVEAVFVAEGQVVEEVFHGFDAAGGEVRGYAVADALDEFDRGVEV